MNMTISLDSKRFKKVSAFQNNCALASGAQLIIEELLAVPDETIDAADLARFKWRAHFLNYYGLPADTSLSAIRNLIKKFPHPRDQQTLLSPILRLLLVDLLPEGEKAAAGATNFLDAAKAGVLFNHLGFSLEAHTKAGDGDEFVVDTIPAADATKTLRIVHSSNFVPGPHASWHWEIVGDDETSAIEHNTAFDATDHRLPVNIGDEPDAVKLIVANEFTGTSSTEAETETETASSTDTTATPPSVEVLKTNWLALIETEQAKANTQSETTNIHYHYRDATNNVVTFWTSKTEQERIDRLLAERIGWEEDLAGEFSKLPSIPRR
jgi:hypothetical protein